MLNLLLAVLTAAAPPVPVAPLAPPAPPPVVSPADRPSEAEALALVRAYAPSALRRESELRMLRESFVPALQANDDTAAMFKAFPALGPALVDVLAANVDIYMSEYDERFLPRAAAIFRNGLSRADTLELTRFYQSSVGQKALRSAVSHVDGAEVAKAGLEGRGIDAGITKRQVLAAGWGAIADLSPAERDVLMAQVSSPSGQHFLTLVPQLVALQTELANNPGPRFKASVQQGMAQTFQRITGLKTPAK